MTTSPVGMASGRAKMPWIVRGIEEELLREVQLRPFFIHVAGRRRMGKSSTVTRVLNAVFGEQSVWTQLQPGEDPTVVVLQQLPSHLWVGVPSHLWVGVEAGALEGPYNANLLKKPMAAAIRAGWVFAFDEISSASVVMQCVLQAVIDEVEYGVQFLREWVPEKCGGIIVLGSHPMLDEETIHGYQKPLFSRFRTRVTVSPLKANELAAVFKHYSIVSGSTMLAVSALTGGCPGMLNTLCKAGLLRDDVDVGAMCTALYSGAGCHSVLANFYSESIGTTYSTMIRAIFNDHGRSSLDDQISLVSELLPGDVNHAETVRSMLEHLARRHGTIALESALFPLAAYAAGNSAKEPPDRYVVVDTALSSYVRFALKSVRFSVSTPSSESVAELQACSTHSSSSGHAPGLSASPPVTATDSDNRGLEPCVADHDGFVLETRNLIRSITRQRRYFALPQLPCLPASYGPADVMWGSWAGLEDVGGIDFVAFYHLARVVVFGSTKRSASEALGSVGKLRRAVNELQTQLRAAAASAKASTRISPHERILIDDSYKTELVLFTRQFTDEQRRRWNLVSAASDDHDGVESRGGAGAASSSESASGARPPTVQLCDLVELFDFGDRVARMALSASESLASDRGSLASERGSLASERVNQLDPSDLDACSGSPSPQGGHGSLNAFAVALLTVLVVIMLRK